MASRPEQTLTIHDRKVTVWLPPTYGHSNSSRYPAVYVHDGGKLMESCYNYIQRQFREHWLEELIIVGVHSESRNDEYSPWPAEALAEGRPSFGGRGPDYIDELADSVKPFIDSRYRTRPEPSCTGMIGGSLGGLVTLLAAYRRPDAFGRFGLLSPSLWFEGMSQYIAGSPVPSGDLRFYLSVGSCEGIYKHNIQRESFPAALALCRKWESSLPPVNLRIDTQEGATHDFMFMTGRFPEALKQLYSPSSVEEQSSLPDYDHADTDQDLMDQDDTDQDNTFQASPSLPDAGPPKPYAVPGSVSFDLHSRINGLDYRIMVYQSQGPAPSAGYPVLYAADGNACFASLAEALRLQTRHPKGLPQGIIVGIGYPSDEPFVTDRRFLDLTVPDKQEGLRPDGSAWPDNGGADQFLDVIEHELMPEIARRFPVDPDRTALFGHSLGGFFSLYAMTERTRLFRSYIAGSPSLWWKDRYLFKRIASMEREGKGYGARVSVLIGTGSEEKDFMIEDSRLYYEALSRLQGKGGLTGSLRYTLFEGEGHVSVLHAMISPLLRFAFAEYERYFPLIKQPGSGHNPVK